MNVRLRERRRRGVIAELSYHIYEKPQTAKIGRNANECAITRATKWRSNRKAFLSQTEDMRMNKKGTKQ